MKLYCANMSGNAKNTYYPQEISYEDGTYRFGGSISTNPDADIYMLEVACSRDHMCAAMKDHTRDTDNYLGADVLMLDLDNTHSEDPDEWRTLDDVADAFPEITFYAVESRNHMKEKRKTDKNGKVTIFAPRPKYHIYIPLSYEVTKEEYTDLIMKCLLRFPYFDPAALDPARFFFGVPDPKVAKITGCKPESYENCENDEFLFAVDRESIKPTIEAAAKIPGVEAAVKKLRSYFEVPDETRETSSPESADIADIVDNAERERSKVWLFGWFVLHGVDFGRSYTFSTKDHPGAFAVCVPCPWSDEHSEEGPDNESVVILEKNGKLNYLCRHAHCIGRGWQEYRAKIEELAGGAVNVNAVRRTALTLHPGKQADFYDPETWREAADRMKTKVQEGKAAEKVGALSAADYMKAMFDTDIEYFAKYKGRKMGLHPEIDEYLTLYPGLAFLGGASSLGKTTLLSNIAESLLSRGETVLFFSLEQLPIELITKALTHKLYQRDPFTPITNAGIKDGATNSTLEAVRAEITETAKNYYIIPGNFHMTVADIRSHVEKFKQDHGVRPIVIVDYLQLIAPPEGFRGGVREYTDENVKALKDMQKENELFVLCASSFNRSSNFKPVSYESFKESSMIEFTADYVFGLQLSVLDAENTDFYVITGPQGGTKVRSDESKIRLINAEQGKIPKAVEFVSLKSRNTKQFYKANFHYYPQFDTFVPTRGTYQTNYSSNPFDDDQDSPWLTLAPSF